MRQNVLAHGLGPLALARRRTTTRHQTRTAFHYPGECGAPRKCHHQPEAGALEAFKESGLEKRPRMHKQGNGALRKAMYRPAVTLMKSKADHALTRFRDRLLSEGQTRRCVVGALMLKLL
jgi:hypothetical protein